MKQSFVGLLRGINVGGKSRLAMDDLQSLLGGLGLERPFTYIQSGNFGFISPDHAVDLEAQISAEIFKALGLAPLVFVVPLTEWESLIAANPYREMATNDPQHLVIHRSHMPFEPDEVASVQAAVPGRERMVALGHTLYVNCPDGIGRSSLPKAKGWNRLIDKTTGRNWNTVIKLAELARALDN